MDFSGGSTVQRNSSPPPDLVLLAGQIGSGKTTVAVDLSEAGGARLVRVRVALQESLGGDDVDRAELQRRGAELDRRSGGRWLLEYLQRGLEADQRVVLDAARTRIQTEPLLEQIRATVLVYLDATTETRKRRYALGQRTDPVKRSISFAEAMRHPTEVEAITLRAMAHHVVDTNELTVADVVEHISGLIGWQSSA